ncbi:MAG: hypothetical protein H6R18_2072 [Proteobacteria bacterium]|nr:hypothetical protein [Pseudomonadota bacterium]
MKKLVMFLAAASLVTLSACGNKADQAAKDKDLAKVKELLAKDPNLVKAVSKDIGETALAIAAFRGNNEMVEFLLQNKADPNAFDSYGVYPILGAARMDRAQVIETLLKNKVDVNTKKKNGETALHYAAEFDSAEAAKVLLANGADKGAKDAEGKTPLDVATAKNNAKVLAVLK